MNKVDSGILQWMDKEKMINSKGERFEWTFHSFLIDPMSDWSPRIAVRKSSQIGFSESFGIMKALYGALRYKWNIIYTLPSDRFAEKFATTKVDPIVEYNPVLSRVVSGGRMVKKAGERFIFFRGTHNVKTKDAKIETDKGISDTSDLNIHDERDRSDQGTIEQFESRIENSNYAGIWNFSNPTYPGVGTDAIWEKSDQKLWMVKCGCGHYQYMDWVMIGEKKGIQDHCLIDPKGKFLCGKCHKELSDTTRMRGEWVATYPKRDISGYWMSQMNYGHHKAKRMLEKEEAQTKQNFYNFSLGKPYRGTDVAVERAIIVKNLTQDSRRGKVAIGVDNGIWKHYVIGDESGIFKFGKTKSWEEIESFITKYNAYMVIDSNPYPLTPKQLIKKYPGKVYASFYKSDKDMIGAVEYKRGSDRGVVYIQRTNYFDILVDKFVNKEKPINMLQRELEEFIKHWETLSRYDIKDAMGVMKGEWRSSTGRDHYAHATLYQDVAFVKSRGRHGFAGSYDVNKEESNVIEIDDQGFGTLPSLDRILKESIKDTNNDWRY